ncbi:MAG: hypothetical protein H0U52_03925 [Chloroflexi bacterium]|nr:hypothetical protein [Chloroflexota bacterium]
MLRRPSLIRLLVAAALGLALIGAGPLAPRAAAAERSNPKVVLIVGPVGSVTPFYRRLADEAAAAAAKLTSNVVKVYSPNATWPAVKAALKGASVVVYLGHGNGFPSIYRKQLYGRTQNGFGLNPYAGAADAHQYFGEDLIGSQIKLAKDAVVIFSRLCYASGNTEPGLAEGTLAQAQQRVDNYAAGFFRAGAGAVIADAFLPPSYYVASVLRGTRTIDSIWKNAPSRNDHFLRFPSQRTKGAIAQMDPEQVDSGFYRSIVLKAKLTSSQVVGNAVRPGSQPEIVLEPTLTGLGVTFGAPDLTTPPTVGAKTSLTLPVAADAAGLLPDKLMVGTRWDRLDGGPAAPAGPAAPDTPAAAASPGPAAPGDDPGTTAAEPPPIDLVTPERTGEIVAPVAAKKLKGGGIEVPVLVPTNPGLYRLVSTVHQADGQAFDAATQALIPALVVRVTGPLTATYTTAPTATASAGAPFSLDVVVTNLGRSAWGNAAEVHRVDAAETVPASRAILVARWVDLGAAAIGASTPAGTLASSILPAGLAPGKSIALDFRMTAPAAAGEYLLVLDVVDPKTGSLAAAGVPPGIVRVTVIR